ncbi:hypothetical protein CJ030_MR7G000294 [Morella rubra]|uniref:Uncharacterized protein n=1 Tax=Morella rubra TaxID=262757 RepID=A0A6A1V6R9_9ROSI|nr:hypothetical protein CJ030_MR7G000294 [Morella rubra]
MSTVRTRSAAKKQPSVKDTNAVTAPTSNVPNGINADPDTPKNPPVRQLSMQRRATQTLTSTAANLANLLPTGTLLAFQLLTPMFTNNGACDSATRTMTLVLLVLLALSCFLASFTDSVKASDGQVYYGFTTFKAQQRGHSTGFKVGSAASMATGPGPAEPKSSSCASTGSQKDAASTSVGTEPNSTSSSSTDSQNAAASSSGATEPYSTSSGSFNPQTDDDLSSETEPDRPSREGSDSPNTAAFYGGSLEKSKRAIRRPSRLEDYILY